MPSPSPRPVAEGRRGRVPGCIVSSRDERRTQAQRLADHYGVEHVASGDLLRAEFQAVIHLQVDRDELRRRMLALEGRLDDTRVTIEHRLEIFDEQTQPLVRYYTDRGLVQPIDGNQDVEDVTAAILEALAGLAEDDGPSQRSSA